MSNETQTEVKENQSNNPITEAFSAKLSLVDKLAVLNEEQIEAICAIYQDAVSSDKLDDLALQIQTDTNQEQSSKLIKLIDDNYLNYMPEYRKYDSLDKKHNLLKKQASKIAKKKKEYKEVLDGREATLTRELKLMTKDEKELKDELEKQMLKRAFEKRDKLRKRGRVAYLKGVVAAVIDGCHDEYIKETNERANLVVNAAEKLLNDDPKESSKTEEGTEVTILALSEYYQDAPSSTDNSSTSSKTPKKKLNNPK